MSLEIPSVRYLRSGNIIDSGRSAVITLPVLDPHRRIGVDDLARRLAAFRCTCR